MGGGVNRLGFGVLLAVTLDGRTGLIPGRAWTARLPIKRGSVRIMSRPLTLEPKA